jgi:hypothetical protein
MPHAASRRPGHALASPLGTEDFSAFRIDEMHLRTDGAIHRNEGAFLCWLIFWPDMALHLVTGVWTIEEKDGHKREQSIFVPETSTPQKHMGSSGEWSPTKRAGSRLPCPEPLRSARVIGGRASAYIRPERAALGDR